MGGTHRGVERKICRLRHRHSGSRPRRPDTADGVSEKQGGGEMWAKIRFVRVGGSVRSAVRARTLIYGRCWAACPVDGTWAKGRSGGARVHASCLLRVFPIAVCS